MIVSDFISCMRAAGVSAEKIVEVVEHYGQLEEGRKQEKEAERREKEREKKRRQREERMSPDVPGTIGDKRDSRGHQGTEGTPPSQVSFSVARLLDSQPTPPLHPQIT